MAANAGHIVGSWIRGEQEGTVGSWLSTMKETWKFNVDLTYEHTTERYEGGITTGPFFQSSYSRPTGSVQRGIWAPPDWIRDQLDLFVMSSLMARGSAAIDCGRAIQVSERQSTFYRRATHLLIIQNRLRCGFAQFQLCAHLLQARNQLFNLFLLVSVNRFLFCQRGL